MEYPADCSPSSTPPECVRSALSTRTVTPLFRMVPLSYVCLLSLFVLSGCEFSDLEEAVEGLGQTQRFDPIELTYPNTFRDTAVLDDYFGYTISDHYRWLEVDQSQSVVDWSTKQNALTQHYLQQVPFTNSISQRLGQLATYYRRGTPTYHAGYYYFKYNPGDWPQDALARAEQLTDSVTIVLNPNTWAAGPNYELGRYAFSADGRFLTYEQQHPNKEESTLRLVDLLESEALEDEIRVWGLSTLSWYKGGFYYTTFPGPSSGSPQQFHRLFYHQLGARQTQDELVFADHRFPERRITAYPDTLSQSLVLELRGDGPGNAAYFRPLDSEDPSFIPLTENLDYRFEWAGGTSQHLHFVTDLDADKGRLIKVNKTQPEPLYWEDVIAERGDVIGAVWHYANQWIVDYWRDATSHVLLFSEQGRELRRLHLPEPGTITEFSTGKSAQELFFGFTTYLRPETVYRLDADTYRSALLYSPHPNFKAEDYLLRQEWVTAYDDTPLPVFILHRKDLPMTQPQLTLLVNTQNQKQAQLPHWNATGSLLIPAVLEQGGVVVLANLRGSTGFGRSWQRDGRRTLQQQALDDLQAVGEYLREQSYVSPERLAVYGYGVGATLATATLNQRPDLFTAAVAENGWYDLLNYHQFPGSLAYQDQFGTVRDSLECDHVLSYSPLHNAVPNKFPATLLLSSGNSAPAVPLHSRKLAAELQAQQKGQAPILWYSGSGEDAEAKENTRAAAILAFLVYQTKTTWQ